MSKSEFGSVVKFNVFLFLHTESLSIKLVNKTKIYFCTLVWSIRLPLKLSSDAPVSMICANNFQTPKLR